MASASYMSDDVEPKPVKYEDREHKFEELKKKAFISPILPEDFLRVLLDPKQIAESRDSQLARQLQYGMTDQQQRQPMGLFGLSSGGMHREYIDYGRGRLQIDVVEAKLNKNYGWITRMDPYVRIKVGPRMFETPTSYNGNKNPAWRKSIICFLPRNVDSLVIEIFDEKSFSEDEMIAFAKFPLPKSLFDGIFLDEWIPLSGKLGEHKEGYINLQMLFTPLETLRNDAASSRAQQPVAPAQTTVASATLSTTPPSSTSTSLPSDVVQPNQVQLPPELSATATSNSSTAAVSASPQATASPTAASASASASAASATASATVPTYSQEDLKAIQDMFPHFDADVIKSIMELNRGNKEASIEALLQMN